MHDIKAGATTHVTFNISAASLAVVDESSGDTVVEAAKMELLFDHGTGDALQLDAAIVGKTTTIEKFPEDKP